jgi:cytochrome c-type biogenesis protein CcmE
MRAKYIFGIVIIVGFIIWAGVSFNKTLTPYVSIAEAKASSDMVQVKGQRAGKGTFDTEKNLFTFGLIDDRGDKITVIFDGTKPGNFEQATEVVCVGKYVDGTFQAKEILVKCPSKYMEEQSQV